MVIERIWIDTSIPDEPLIAFVWESGYTKLSLKMTPGEFAEQLLIAASRHGAPLVAAEIRAEADAMIARSSRGIARDDAKTAEDWDASLGSLLNDYEPRRMWIKIAALAVRAIEAIDGMAPQ